MRNTTGPNTSIAGAGAGGEITCDAATGPKKTCAAPATRAAIETTIGTPILATIAL